MIEKLKGFLMYTIMDHPVITKEGQVKIVEKLNEVIDVVNSKNKERIQTREEKDKELKQTLNKCLIYCRHRMAKHPNCGLCRSVSKEELNSLLRKCGLSDKN
jgi:hypothetical protein